VLIRLQQYFLGVDCRSSTCFAEIKSTCTCTVKSRFPVHLLVCNTHFGQYWLSTVYFLGDVNETFRLLFVHAHLRMCQVSLKNIQKIKYAIFLDLFFITEWIALKLKILTDIKIRFP
jgi:hypothetical protein